MPAMRILCLRGLGTHAMFISTISTSAMTHMYKLTMFEDNKISAWYRQSDICYAISYSLNRNLAVKPLIAERHKDDSAEFSFINGLVGKPAGGGIEGLFEGPPQICDGSCYGYFRCDKPPADDDIQ